MSLPFSLSHVTLQFPQLKEVVYVLPCTELGLLGLATTADGPFGFESVRVVGSPSDTFPSTTRLKFQVEENQDTRREDLDLIPSLEAGAAESSHDSPDPDQAAHSGGRHINA